MSPLSSFILSLFLAACNGEPRSPTRPDGDGAGNDPGDPPHTGETGETGNSVDTADTSDTAPPDPEDADGDSYNADTDCDDTDPSVYPGAPEVCGDGLVNDCDGTAEDATAVCPPMATPDDALASWSLTADSFYNLRAAGVGDINGDGLGDLALGWPDMTGLETGTDGGFTLGGVLLYLGPQAGPHARGDEDGFFYGVEEWDGVGWDLVAMGDVDGDGYDDFAVGAAEDEYPPPTGTPAVYRVDGPADITSISEAVLLVEGTEEMACLGSTLAAVPDHDGDGATDLLVGGRCTGVAHLLSGGGDSALEAGADDIATFTGPSAESRFGHAMAAGDFDGDGLADVAIGAPEIDLYPDDILGFVSIFSGPLSGARTSADADATVAAAEGDTAEGSSEALIFLFGTGVAAGDLNSDGYDDLVAGGPKQTLDASARETGGAFVFLGPLSPALGIPDAHLSIHGEVYHDRVGGEMDAAHDLDGDGHADLLMGGGYLEVNGDFSSISNPAARSAWVFRGPVASGTVVVSEADYSFVGEGIDSYAIQVRVAGDGDGDGLPEIIVGNTYDTIHLFDLPLGGY